MICLKKYIQIFKYVICKNIIFIAWRGHAGVALIPNLFGKPTVLIVGGGLLDTNMDEVTRAYPYVESSQV